MGRASNMWAALRGSPLPFTSQAGAASSLSRLLSHEAYDTDPLVKTGDTLKACAGWVFSAVTTIAHDVRATPWAIWAKSGARREDWKAIENVPPVMLRPSATHTWGDLIEETQIHMDLAGKAFWNLITPEGSDRVVGIQIINPDWIDRPLFDESKTHHTGWRLSVPGKAQATLRADDVMFFRYPDPVDPFGGLSPVRAVALSHDMDIYSRAYAGQFLRNHAQPTGILTTDADLTHEQADTIRDAWDDRHLGTTRIQVLGKGASYQPLSAALSDLAFLDLARVSRDQILSAFHMPASKVGLVEDSSRANGEESDRVYSALCLGPRLKRYEEPITLRLLPRLGLDPSRYAFEFESVEVGDKEFNRVAAGDAFTRGAITLDEYRAAIGMEPERNGNGAVYFVPLGSHVTDVPSTGMAPMAMGATEAGGPVENEAARGEAGVGESVAPDLVLNGAQVTSLIQIVASMLEGALPYTSALEIIQSAFAMSEEKARKILGPESAAGSLKTEPAAPEQAAERTAEIEARIESAGVALREDVEIDDPTDEALELSSMRFLRSQDESERKLKSQIRSLFSQMQKELMATPIRRSMDRASKDKPLTRAEVERIMKRQDRVTEKYIDKWIETLEGESFTLWREGAGQFATDVKMGLDWVLLEPKALEFMRSHIPKVVGDISKTTKTRLRNVLSKSLEEGLAPSDTADRIGSIYNDFKGVRAETIARTESAGALNAGRGGHASAFAEANPDLEVKKTWSPTQDERTRLSHKRKSVLGANGGSRTIPIDQKFRIGPDEKGRFVFMDRPHDPEASGPSKAIAGNIVRCRCTLVHRVMAPRS